MNLADAQTTLQTRLQALDALTGIAVLLDDPEDSTPSFDDDWERALNDLGVVVGIGADLSGGSSRRSVMGETVFDVRYPIFVCQNTVVRKVQLPDLTFGEICDGIIAGFVDSDDVEVVDISELSETDGGSLMRIIVLEAELSYTH